MPRRAPIDPQGMYHVSSRGCYGRTLFDGVGQHEMFLWMYGRVALKYRWQTLSWALMQNHHHFVVHLTEGSLSEGMRVLHGGYSRWIHEMYGQTRQGHLFRHAFFARQLLTTEAAIDACAYVDVNPSRHRPTAEPAPSDWGGFAATIGRSHARRFHSPGALLELVHPTPRTAQRIYRHIVEERHRSSSQDPSPNDVPEASRD